MKFLSSFARRVARSIPPLHPTLCDATFYGAAIALAGLAAQMVSRGSFDVRIVPLGLVLVLGGALAYGVTAFADRLFGFGNRPLRLGFAFVLLLGLTLFCTAGFFALQYRQYYAQWHSDFPSITWVFQLVFTLAAAAYQFAVLGTRLLLPFAGIIAAVGTWRLCTGRLVH